MPVFHFNIVDGVTIADAGGEPCSDLAEAREIARALALRLARAEPQLIGKGFAIAVMTADGDEVYRAELDKLNRQVLAH